MKQEGKTLDSEYIKDWEKKASKVERKISEHGVHPDMLVLSKEQDFDHYEVSQCCKPLPGDDILGFEDGKTIQIHRTACENAMSLMSSFGSQIIKAKWEADGQADVAFLIGIKVVGLDKQGMLNDLIRIISLRMKLNIRRVTIESRDKVFEGVFNVFIHNTNELNQLASRMEAIPHVYTVSRVDGDYQPFHNK